MPSSNTSALEINTDHISPFTGEGQVRAVSSLGVEIDDALSMLQIGSRVEIETDREPLLCEVVSISEARALALPFDGLTGVRRGARVKFLKAGGSVCVSPAWLGRVVDAFGHPLDGKGPIPQGGTRKLLQVRAPGAAMRARLGAVVDFGVPALDLFTPARAGQRLGVFAASGVGKSALLAMIARNTDCDVAVIALIGERGREVRDFIEDHLGPEKLARSVIIVATSDESPMRRREAGFLAMTVAEYFRDRSDGAHVLTLFDSLTRIAMAQREIALASGEPPAAKGYAPSVFSMLPALIERAGPGVEGTGRMTGIFTVLVEGDDHDEPIADAARAAMDGHIVLERAIAERGRLPAVNVLRSVSRGGLEALSDDARTLVGNARDVLATYEEMRDMIRIGAYKSGANPDVDRAIALQGKLEDLLSQDVKNHKTRAQAEAALNALLQGNA